MFTPSFVRLCSFLLVSLLLLPGCSDDGTQGNPDPCKDVTCSGAGTCHHDDVDVWCDCHSGYYPEGLECLPEDTTPVISSEPGTKATAGLTFSYEIVCTDAQGDELSLSLKESHSCGGELVDNGDGTGSYTFLPTAEQVDTTCTLAVVCADSTGQKADQSVEVEISSLESEDIITNLPATQTSHWGNFGSFQVEVGNDFSIDELQWILAGSDCTFQVLVDPAGLVYWTCGDVETCSVQVRAMTLNVPTYSDTQTLTIECTNSAPEILSVAPGSVTEGTRYRYEVSCQDSDGDDVTVSVDPTTDTCGGVVTDATYSFAPANGTGGSSCVVGIVCGDTQKEVTQTSTVDVEEFNGVSVRVVAGNVTSGNYQSYDPGHGIRILQALQPDIVLVQEMNYLNNTAVDYQAFSDSILGPSYFAVDDANFQIPNGVISVWPIIASGYWDDPSLSNRELFWAEIDIPGSVDLFVVSVHLHTNPPSDQVEAAQVIVSGVQAHQQSHPGGFYYVVGGDFNGTDAVTVDGFGTDSAFDIAAPFPVDDDGNPYTNAPRTSHYDFILTDSTLGALQIPVEYQSNFGGPLRSYVDGLVFDTRTFTQGQLDEYFSPTLVADSDAAGMQHMAVVKDFFIE